MCEWLAFTLCALGVILIALCMLGVIPAAIHTATVSYDRWRWRRRSRRERDNQIRIIVPGATLTLPPGTTIDQAIRALELLRDLRRDRV